ncbi:quinoprotein glucose dehydrogenase [Bacillus aerolatus]|uniref:Quinoprotein glucose dehydrogenase n=1 Tax=Bacillus aerolatus TaxID=2653354 RepID=A0A6I1FK04_9BACI|nr:PQQ-dependent sugar dehydrogenase [Bacillus aerolatus]KAB7708930.1 quinoprotein glucose dehydrogenase [Bacillus aerolatus]
MKKWMLAALVLLPGCTVNEERPAEEQAALTNDTVDTGQVAEVIATNLTIPWDITKPKDDFFISQRGGNIVHVHPDGKKEEMQLKLKKTVSHEGEGGLLGFELDTDFHENSLAYVYHTYRDGERLLNRIVQVQKVENGWEETKELLARIPGGSIHNGGRLAIGPDSKLYATAGDAGVKDSAQNKQALSGKILRLNLDGSIPEDNPFSDSYVYTLGHRNPQGMAWAEDGTMYAAEHGQSAHDEINTIKPGRNYGWPVIEGDEKQEGMETPLFHSGEETWAPSGMAFKGGKLFVAALRGEKVLSFDLKNHEITVFYSGAGRLRDVYVSNNYLFIVTNNTDGRGTPAENDDRLLRLPLSITSH